MQRFVVSLFATSEQGGPCVSHRIGSSDLAPGQEAAPMPYLIVLMPMLAFVGLVGAIVSLIRGRSRSALGFGIVGVSAILFAVTLSYTSA
jgi:hypothetical protein